MGFLFLKHKKKFMGVLTMKDVDFKLVKEVVLESKTYLVNGIQQKDNDKAMRTLIRSGRTSDLQIVDNNDTFSIKKEKMFYDMYKYNTFYTIEVNEDIIDFMNKYHNYDITKFYTYIRTFTESVRYYSKLKDSKPINVFSAISPYLDEVGIRLREYVKFETDDNVRDLVNFMIEVAEEELKVTKPNQYKKLNDLNDILYDLNDMLRVIKRETKQ